MHLSALTQNPNIKEKTFLLAKNDNICFSKKQIKYFLTLLPRQVFRYYHNHKADDGWLGGNTF